MTDYELYKLLEENGYETSLANLNMLKEEILLKRDMLTESQSFLRHIMHDPDVKNAYNSDKEEIIEKKYGKKGLDIYKAKEYGGAAAFYVRRAEDITAMPEHVFLSKRHDSVKSGRESKKEYNDESGINNKQDDINIKQPTKQLLKQSESFNKESNNYDILTENKKYHSIKRKNWVLKGRLTRIRNNAAQSLENPESQTDFIKKLVASLTPKQQKKIE